MNDNRNSGNAKSIWMKHVDRELESLDKEKVDDKVCREKHGNVERIANEAKAIALAAKHKSEKPHLCTKEDILEDLKGWKKWLRAGVFSLAFVVILGIAAWYTQRSEIEKSLVKQEENVKQMKSSVEVMKKSQEGILVKFKLQEVQDKKKKKEDLEEIKEAVTEAIKSTERRSRRSRRDP